MFRHLFILIWNKKKENFLLMVEMLISFLVLFAVFTMLVYYYSNYRKPVGLDDRNVWVVSYDNSFLGNNKDSIRLFYETLRQTLKAMPQVKEVSLTSGNAPFFSAMIQSGISHNGKTITGIDWYQVEDGYRDVLHLKMLEGRWFDKQDAVGKDKPVVINSALKEKMFGDGPAIGKQFGGDGKKIIGVVQDVKMRGDYAMAGPAAYHRIDTSTMGGMGKMLISVTPDADVAFEGRLYKTIAAATQHRNVEIEHLENKRAGMNSVALLPVIILSVVAGFLIINVALGLFGVLWYNISKRRGEIGLRRAVGATGRSVSAQLVAETLILSTLSLIIGAFFAIQFPLLDVFDLAAGTYLTALLLSVLFIYLLVVICSLYPGRQAAAIYPAVALHED